MEVVSVPFGLDSLVFCRSETPQLFTVLPEKRTATVGGASGDGGRVIGTLG